MPNALLLSVRFHDGRYHGTGTWPPSPARLYQALVAGAAEGATIPPAAQDALAWLERLPPPVIAAPPSRTGDGYKTYVPNNDLDAKGGDPARVAEIRAPKQIRPLLFDAAMPLLYIWRFEEGEDKAAGVVSIAARLYQLGRGVDMAFATGELLDEADAERCLAVYDGAIFRPARSGEGTALSCPMKGTLKSLKENFKKMSARITFEREGRIAQTLFTQPPKPRLAQVPYNSPPERRLYDLRDLSAKERFHAWPLNEAARLVEMVRDKAAARLRNAYQGVGRQDRTDCVERIFIGRDAMEADKPVRIRITPLPSIGFHHADPSIRRILLEIPPDCPLPRADVAWAFTGLGLVERIDLETGEISQDVRLVEAEDRRMLGHYGIEGDRRDVFRLWRTVTPAALPEGAARRRIDPKRMQAEAKAAAERAGEEARAASAVLHALRHARIMAKVEAIRVQREPFAAKGARAETFAPGTRFAKERLWHVEIAFAEPAQGPIVIGDGRYLGLGLMAPVKDTWRDEIVFPLLPETRVAIADSAALLRAVRRALMALSRDSKGAVPRLFSGHEINGASARSGGHEHIFLAADDTDSDGRIDRLIVVAPWACDGSGRGPRHSDRALFDQVVSSLSKVRAGKLGVIALGLPSILTTDDPVFGPARIWESRTPYRPTRHASRGKDPAAAVMQDAITECVRRGLPRPKPELLELAAGSNGGNLTARLCLRFAVAVEGPIMLGRDSHMGGGLFTAADEGKCAD